MSVLIQEIGLTGILLSNILIIVIDSIINSIEE